MRSNAVKKWGKVMLERINVILSGVAVPLLLCFAGVFFSVRLRVLSLIRPRAIARALRSGEGERGVSSASALCLALAGTLGVGNIVGVASAIHLGGAGAILWMWVSALLAMVLKYAETALAIKYRTVGEDGKPRGSAMLYIRAFFDSMGAKRLGRAVAAVFAVAFVACSLTMGGMLQSEAAAEALDGTLGLPRIATGVAFSVAAFLLGRKGTGGLLRVTGALVPLMSAGFAVLSLAVIFKNADNVCGVLARIFSDAFSFRAAAGGAGGFAFMRAVRYGVMRGLMSNEAGCGTAPVAHSMAECDDPVRQGTYGIIEVFVDTVVLCTLTALCVLLEYDSAGAYGGSYMMMTVAAYSGALGAYAGYFLSAAVLCFAFATVICWGHYGCSAIEYLGGGRRIRNVFCVFYAVCTLIGACAPSHIAWQISDLAMGIMTVINLTVLIGGRNLIPSE